jgi:hypothetical protein
MHAWNSIVGYLYDSQIFDFTIYIVLRSYRSLLNLINNCKLDSEIIRAQIIKYSYLIVKLLNWLVADDNSTICISRVYMMWGSNNSTYIYVNKNIKN